MEDKMEYEIEKGIDIPKQNKGKAKYPFGDLEVGESFFVPSCDSNSMRAGASYHTKTTGKKFITRTIDGGVRIWRTE